jgi:Concanavalin A-like lectin/glucanases superfamily
MNMVFPSHEFDDSVAAVCHGMASDEQMRSLNKLLRTSPAARDEYLLRVELHARLASDPDLFVSGSTESNDAAVASFGSRSTGNIIPFLPRAFSRRPMMTWAISLAACFLILAAAGLNWFRHHSSRRPTSIAVAVLSYAVKAQWASASDARAAGGALEPGWLRLKSGLVQVTFYSGARMAIEGPAQVQLISPGEAFCKSGRVMAVVPPQARGFSVGSPQMKVTDLGTEFGLDVEAAASAVHVFKGNVEYQVAAAMNQNLKAGEASVVNQAGVTRLMPANPEAFANLFDLQRRWQAMLARRYEDWRAANARRNQDPSLLARFDFEDVTASGWTLHNVATDGSSVPEGAVVGCQVTEGRWPGKPALAFRSPSDRVRFTVPGEFRALTFSAWVNVQGLDRQFNSLFMCDGFDAGKIHWQICNDGVLDMGVQGPRVRDVQIFMSPAVVGFNQFGQWLHLAAVLDGEHRQMVHYVNGVAVSRHTLTLAPPCRLGAGELGNWNPGEIANKPPFLIRHFSGAMDEFAIFSRALSDAEILKLYSEGKPEPDF